MEYKYKINCTINWGNSIPEVDKILAEVNKIANDFGYDEKLIAEGKLNWTMTANRELTERELYIVKIVFAHTLLTGTLKTYDIRVQSITKIE